MSDEREALDPLLMDVITHMGGPPMHQILKGHLMIEQELKELLRLHGREPKGLSFDSLLNLVRSIARRDGTEPMWDSIKVVNEVRNKYAHNPIAQPTAELGSGNDQIDDEYIRGLFKHFDIDVEEFRRSSARAD